MSYIFQFSNNVNIIYFLLSFCQIIKLFLAAWRFYLSALPIFFIFCPNCYCLWFFSAVEVSDLSWASWQSYPFPLSVFSSICPLNFFFPTLCYLPKWPYQSPTRNLVYLMPLNRALYWLCSPCHSIDLLLVPLARMAHPPRHLPLALYTFSLCFMARTSSSSTPSSFHIIWRPGLVFFL